MALTHVTALRVTDLDEAVLLAELGTVSRDPEGARRKLLALTADPVRGGALIGRDARDRGCGLLMYRIVGATGSRSAIQVDRLVAVDLTNPRSVADALICGVLRQARRQDCHSLRLVLPLDSLDDPATLILMSGVADLHSVL